MSGPAVVLIHGWGGSSEATWIRTGWCDALVDAGRTVICVDLPGHGGAYPAHDPAAYADLASMIDRELPAGEPLDAIGYSLGGKLLLELASRRPGRFRRIVLGGLGDNLFSTELGSALSAELERGFPAEARARMPAFARYLDESRNDLRAIAAVNRRPFNPVADPARLARIGAEILVITGDADTIAREDTRLRSVLPHIERVTLPGVDHFSLHRQPAFRQAALHFLDRPSVSAAAFSHVGERSSG